MILLISGACVDAAVQPVVEGGEISVVAVYAAATTEAMFCSDPSGSLPLS